MLCIKQRTLNLMISLFTFSKERLTLPQNVLRVQQDTVLSVEITASAPMSEKLIALKVHYFLMFYIQFLLLPSI